MPVFRLEKDSLQHRYLNSRAKVQFFGGGFANGKTATNCIKALNLAKDYPGSNGLMARSTYPKLNDTLRKEFLKWCPNDWIKSFPKSQNASNTCTLNNGTTINFRYIQQQGKSSGEATTSNLLSATYDWIIVDQIEDPEIVEKDFLDLLGRLRGNAKYVGNDPTMPSTGPRYFMITSNPTRNWVYRKLIKPYHDWQNNIVNNDLLCETDDDGKPVFVDGKPVPIIEVFEGSTYENRANLAPDFIKTLEASYTGQMRDRFLLGKWAAYEGLIYSQWDEYTHCIPQVAMRQYFNQLAVKAKQLMICEGYDHGMAVPACYLLAFVDDFGNVFICDGLYEKEWTIEQIAAEIKRIRADWGIDNDNYILADPDVFRRKGGEKKTVGRAVSDMFKEEDIKMIRGENSIQAGIAKVSSYLNVHAEHINPIDKTFGAPYLYVSDHLDFFKSEITDYYWKRNETGDLTDTPMDRNDHAMDTLKYLLSYRPKLTTIHKPRNTVPVGVRRWQEIEEEIQQARGHRHA